MPKLAKTEGLFTFCALFCEPAHKNVNVAGCVFANSNTQKAITCERARENIGSLLLNCSAAPILKKEKGKAKPKNTHLRFCVRARKKVHKT